MPVHVGGWGGGEGSDCWETIEKMVNDVETEEQRSPTWLYWTYISGTTIIYKLGSCMTTPHSRQLPGIALIYL